ncbi:hypothetical protein J6590_005710 [Homalodisca vitripennis]|nr:hypothetical protein J6590_005710 [Homalodisca vitripennis]
MCRRLDKQTRLNVRIYKQPVGGRVVAPPPPRVFDRGQHARRVSWFVWYFHFYRPIISLQRGAAAFTGIRGGSDAELDGLATT